MNQIEMTNRKAQHRGLSVSNLPAAAALAVLVLAAAACAVGWLDRSSLAQQWRWYAVIRPYRQAQFRAYVLDAAQERALKPGDTFQECAADCPAMVVVPAGSFLMGSPQSEPGHRAFEQPQHRVAIARRFAIGKFEVTFAEWDACAAHGDCDSHISDNGFGRGRHPAINVTFDDAERYARWLSQMTGKPYRLPSEAEYEYAARAGAATAYPWGDAIGTDNADCNGCGSRFDDMETAPVGSFSANRFGLYDMVGNVYEWVADCLHANYRGAPSDGSAWMAGGACNSRMIRGGSWADDPVDLRSAARPWSPAAVRRSFIGFRVARTLSPR
jgi:formylglycine-generating enzyme required for sulfatase activity